MKRLSTSQTGRAMRVGIAGSLVVLALSSLQASQALAQQIMVTISSGTPGDQLNGPQHLVFDSQGNLFISDTGNHRIRRLDTHGVMTSVVGTGVSGNTGDGGRPTSSQLMCPAGLAFGTQGSLLIADPCANVVRRVAPSAVDGLIQGRADEIITTFAGGGSLDPTVAMLPILPTNALLASPFALTVDSTDSVFISTVCGVTSLFPACVAFQQPGAVIVVNGATGNIGTVYPIYEQSARSVPWSLALDVTGKPIVGTQNSSDNDPIECTSGWSSNIDWTSFGPGRNERLAGLAFDSSGNLYASADVNAHSVFQLAPPAGRPMCTDLAPFSDSITLFAGNGTQGYSGDGGAPASAQLNQPRGLAFTATGNLFIADSGNNVIRGVIKAVATDGTAPVTPLDQYGNAAPVTVAFNGQVTQPGVTALVIGGTAPSLPGNFSVDGLIYDISTTAGFTGSVTVCLPFNPVTDPSPHIYHFENVPPPTWVDRTTSVDNTNHIVCGTVSSLSPFAVLISLAGSGNVSDTLMVAPAGAGNITLSWGGSCASTDNDYAVYEGDIGSWYSHAARLCSTGGLNSATLTPHPENTYYLIVPRSAAHEGFYGKDSSGRALPQGGSACAVQQVALSCP